MLCMPEQLFNSAHTAKSKGLFMRPGSIQLCALAFSMYFASCT